MKHIAGLAMFLSTTFTACSTAPLRPAERPVAPVVPSSADCSFTPTYREDRNCCVMKPYQTSLPVDAAFAAALGEYNYRPEPRSYELEGEAYPDLYRGHLHELFPGSMYRLQGIVLPRSSSELARGVWLGLQLRRVNAEVTSVEPAYCEVGGWAVEDQTAWHRAVQHSIRRTLPPLESTNARH